jgi:hypothetical protein
VDCCLSVLCVDCCLPLLCVYCFLDFVWIAVCTVCGLLHVLFEDCCLDCVSTIAWTVWGLLSIWSGTVALSVKGCCLDDVRVVVWMVPGLLFGLCQDYYNDCCLDYVKTATRTVFWLLPGWCDDCCKNWCFYMWLYLVAYDVSHSSLQPLIIWSCCIVHCTCMLFCVLCGLGVPLCAETLDLVLLHCIYCC